MKSILVCLLLSLCFALLMENHKAERLEELRSGWGKSPALMKMQTGSCSLYYPVED